MIFVIETDNEIAGLDINNALLQAGIQHTILSKQTVEAAQQSVQATKCTECGCCLPDHFANCERQPA